jgi:N-acetylglutamate synthase-like GNAT family acetyltransferase
METDLAFAPASSNDFSTVKELLVRCALSVGDLCPTDLQHFVVCWCGERLVGAAGLDVWGDIAGLSWLAVEPELRGRGVARELWIWIRDHARRRGFKRVYALTSRAEPVFARWGFRSVAREEAPPEAREALLRNEAVGCAISLMMADLTGAPLVPGPGRPPPN